MTDQLFEELKSRLLTFLAKQQELQEMCDLLQKENAELKAELNKGSLQRDSFHNQQKISKIVIEEVGKDEDKAEFKRLLNGYIKEIDRCIVHLKK